jgi:hypothetical protein
MTRLSLASENEEAMSLLRSMSHLSLTATTQSTPDSLDHPISEFLVRGGGLLFEKARAFVLFVRATSDEIDKESPSSRRDLDWFGLTQPARRERVVPGGDLAFLSLSEPDPRTDGQSPADKHDISLIWATCPGET